MKDTKKEFNDHKYNLGDEVYILTPGSTINGLINFNEILIIGVFYNPNCSSYVYNGRDHQCVYHEIDEEGIFKTKIELLEILKNKAEKIWERIKKCSIQTKTEELEELKRENGDEINS